MSSGPLFLATNFRVPAGTLATDGAIENSWRPTDTLVVPDGAGDAALADAATLAAVPLVATALAAGAVVGEVLPL
jgi:hypothetical protein